MSLKNRNRFISTFFFALNKNISEKGKAMSRDPSIYVITQFELNTSFRPFNVVP